jgi:hypothetical protein
MSYVDFNDQVLKSELGISDERIKKINANAEAKLKRYDRLRNSIARELLKYKEDNDLSFKEIKEGLNTSTSQAQRILKGTANFTLETILNISEFIGKDAAIVWK